MDSAVIGGLIAMLRVDSIPLCKSRADVAMNLHGCTIPQLQQLMKICGCSLENLEDKICDVLKVD